MREKGKPIETPREEIPERLPERIEILRELETGERVLKDEVHDEGASWMEKLGKSRMSKWLRRAVLAAALFSAETALADRVSKRELPRSRAETVLGLPPMSHESQQILSECTEISNLKTIDVSIYSLDEKTGTTAQEIKQIDQELIRERKPLKFSAMIWGIDCYKEVPSDEFQILTEGWNHGEVTVKSSEGLETKARFASRRYIDRYGNLIHTFVRLEEGEPQAVQSISITPKAPFGGPGSKKRLVPLALDLREAGLGEIRDALYQTELPPEAFAGKNKFPMHSHTLPAEVMQEAAKLYGESMEKGIMTALKLFGQKLETIKHIYVIDKRHRNAYVSVNNRGVVVFTDEMLETRPRRGKFLTAKEIEYTAAHETFHELDFIMGITEDWSIVKNDLFNGRTRAFLRTITERVFLASPLGHAEDNPQEAFASFMNSLTHPQWERMMQDPRLEKFATGFRRQYLEALKALQAAFLATEEIPREAPIFSLLDKRGKFLHNIIDTKSWESPY